MINLDYDLIQEMLYEYIDGDFDGKSEAVASELSYFNEKFSEILNNTYLNGEFYRVLNVCNTNATEDDAKGIKNISKFNIAYIASHFGFLLGMLHSENVRIHFHED